MPHFVINCVNTCGADSPSFGYVLRVSPCGEFFFTSPKKEPKKATLGYAVFRDEAAKNFPARFASVGRRTNSLSRAIKRESSNSVRRLDRPRLQCSALHRGALDQSLPLRFRNKKTAQKGRFFVEREAFTLLPIPPL
jgi:hypothetical protein